MPLIKMHALFLKERRKQVFLKKPHKYGIFPGKNTGSFNGKAGRQAVQRNIVAALLTT